MPPPITSANLSFLSFALNSWLDGSTQLRRSLILFPFGGQGPSSDAALEVEVDRERLQPRLRDRLQRWFLQPARELNESERVVLGALDVSSSLVLLKLLGTTPGLPLILNPLTLTLALPRTLNVGKIQWGRVVLICLLLSALHEAQRTSVAAGLAWLKLMKTAGRAVEVGEVDLCGMPLPDHDEDEEDDDEATEKACVICSGGSADALSDSVSSLASLSSQSGQSSRPGPLETFCTHAPTKHPMHRSCFIAWKDAYWEGRSSDSFSRPVITLVSDDAAVPMPGTWHWRRTTAILTAALGARIFNSALFVPVAPSQVSAAEVVAGATGEAVFTLKSGRPSGPSRSSRAQEDDDCSLGDLVSSWPPCPGCRSAVKMVFNKAARPFQPVASLAPSSCYPESKLKKAIKLWFKTWAEMVTGRTLLVKTATQVLFAIFLVSMIRVRSSRLRGDSLLPSATSRRP